MKLVQAPWATLGEGRYGQAGLDRRTAAGVPVRRGQLLRWVVMQTGALGDERRDGVPGLEDTIESAPASVLPLVGLMVPFEQVQQEPPELMRGGFPPLEQPSPAAHDVRKEQYDGA